MSGKKGTQKTSDALTEGMIKKGNVNAKPTTPPPPPPKGQGGKSSSKKE